MEAKMVEKGLDLLCLPEWLDGEVSDLQLDLLGMLGNAQLCGKKEKFI